MDLKDKIEQIRWYFPWYNVFYKDEQKLSDLPLMDNAKLKPFYYRNPPWMECHYYETSGTAHGRRKRVYYNEKDEQAWIDKKVKIFRPFLKDISRAVISVGQGHVYEKSPSVMERLGIISTALDINDHVDHHVSVIKSWRPQVLYVTPTILDSYLYRIENPQKLGIKKLILIGERVTRENLIRLAFLFQITIKDIHINYGCTELGTMATYDHDLDKYVAVEGMIFEGVDYPRLEENETMLVVSCFDRECFPSLRFVTYDVVTGLERLPDGRYAFNNITRRYGYDMKHGELISKYEIENIIHDYFISCIISYEKKYNILKVKIKSEEVTEKKLKEIQEKINNVIPEIRTMVENEIIPPIEVVEDTDDLTLYKKRLIIS